MFREFFCGKPKECPICPGCPVCPACPAQNVVCPPCPIPKTVTCPTCPPQRMCPDKIEKICPPEKICPAIVTETPSNRDEFTLFVYRFLFHRQLAKELLDAGLITESDILTMHKNLADKFTQFGDDKGILSDGAIKTHRLQDLLYFIKTANSMTPISKEDMTLLTYRVKSMDSLYPKLIEFKHLKENDADFILLKQRLKEKYLNFKPGDDVDEIILSTPAIDKRIKTDIVNWVKSFTPVTTGAVATGASTSLTKNQGYILGISIGSAILVATLVIVGYLLYQRRRKSLKK